MPTSLHHPTKEPTKRGKGMCRDTEDHTTGDLGRNMPKNADFSPILQIMNGTFEQYTNN